jgi:streptogramin lyase
MRFLKYFIFSFSALVFYSSSSQTIVSYSEADGLLNNYVKCVAVDPNDNVWFGTAFGVSMFDGSSWTNYDQASYPLMLSNDIKAITATTNGDIWIGTDYGVNKLHSGVSGMTWLPFTTNDGLANNKVTRIDEAPNGDLWFSV